MLPVSILFLALLQGLLLQRATAQEVSCSDWLSSNGWSTASEVPWRVQAVCISHLDKLPITVTDTSYRVVATRTITTASYSTRTNFFDPVVTKVRTLLYNIVSTQTPATQTITMTSPSPSSAGIGLEKRQILPAAFNGMNRLKINSACACLDLVASVYTYQPKAGQTVTATRTLPRILSTLITRPESTFMTTTTSYRPRTYTAKIPYVTIWPSATPSGVSKGSITAAMYGYDACYEESSGNRVLIPITSAQNMTVERCLDLCAARSYSVCAMTEAEECWGSPSDSLQGFFTARESTCGMTCGGRIDQMCGGTNAYSTYTLGAGETNPYVAAAAPSGSSAGEESASPSSPVSALSYYPAGCWTDNVEGRALSRRYISSSLTQEDCLAQCASRNAFYCGMECSSECYYGDVIATSSAQTDSGCDMACSGDSSQTCGGSNRLTMYSLDPDPPAYVAPPPPEPINYIYGYDRCLAEPENGRALAALNSSDGMRIEDCLDSCAAAQYVVCGMQYGRECWGGNSLSGTYSDAPESDCSYSCSGDSNEFCGGSYRLSLYTVQAGKTNPWVKPAPPLSSSTMSTSAAPTPTNTGTVASPTRVLTYEDFSYTGCYVEPAGGRVLSRNLGASNTMTVQTCLDLAKQEGLGYAGVEYGSECWGSANPPAASIAIAPDNECNMVCAGDATSYCGNGNRLQVYKSSNAQAAPPASEPTLQTESGDYIYDGCYVDSVNARVLETALAADNTMTVERCLALGAAQSYKYIGLEYGTECFVSNNPLETQLVDNGECSMACAGNTATTCGNGNRLQVYRLKTAVPVSEHIRTTRFRRDFW